MLFSDRVNLLDNNNQTIRKLSTVLHLVTMIILQVTNSRLFLSVYMYVSL